MWIPVAMMGLAASVAVASSVTPPRQASLNATDMRPTAATATVRNAAPPAGSTEAQLLMDAHRRAVDRAVRELGTSRSMGAQIPVDVSDIQGRLSGLGTPVIRCASVVPCTDRSGAYIVETVLAESTQRTADAENRMRAELASRVHTERRSQRINPSIQGTSVGITQRASWSGSTSSNTTAWTNEDASMRATLQSLGVNAPPSNARGTYLVTVVTPQPQQIPTAYMPVNN